MVKEGTVATYVIDVGLDQYARKGTITEGEMLRAYQLVESIVRLHGTVSLGAIQRLDFEHFDQYAPQRRRSEQ